MILTQSQTNKLPILILLTISFIWANHNGAGSNPISNANQLVQNSILQHNNQIASNVAPENRDNFIPAIPLAYALAGTVLTNEYLKSQGGGDAGVGAHRVANQVKEGVSTAYEGVKSVDPHLRQSLENVETGVSFIAQKAIEASDIAVSSILNTNTNKPVTGALQEANQWYDNLPESQKGSVDLAMLLSSVAGGSYLSTANKAINKPHVNLGSVGNNGPNSFPANMGFAEGPYQASLIPGAIIDRYGFKDGYFVAPQGTPIANRSLIPSTPTSSLNTFEVIKPIQVNAGTASPFYGQPGGGMQFELPKSTSTLIDEGYLKLKQD